MASMVFSDEEARFIRLVLKLAERPHDDKRASWMPFGLHGADKTNKAAGEFRILVIGGQGVGKTSLLTKFCTGTFPDPATLPSSDYLHGCRHTITIESSPYTVDALELPAAHLASPEHLHQALAITEAAVLVYDITDPSSLTYLKALSSTIYEALHPSKTSTPTKKRSGFPFPASPTRSPPPPNSTTRPYHFLLLGAKNDVRPSLREVTWLEGHTAAGEFFGPHGVAGGASASFMEVSARTGENVGAVFPLLGREVLRSRREKREGYTRRYGPEGGAWECSGFDFDADEDGSADVDGDCDRANGNRSLKGSVRRRWVAFKALVARGFARDGGK